MFHFIQAIRMVWQLLSPVPIITVLLPCLREPEAPSSFPLFLPAWALRPHGCWEGLCHTVVHYLEPLRHLFSLSLDGEPKSR